MQNARAWIRGLARWIAIAIGAYFVFCTMVLLLVIWINPGTTMVQIQRRVESWLNSGPYEVRQIWVDASAIDEDLAWAVVAAEDGRFFEHWGVDWNAVQKVLEEHRDGRRLRGGSTLTQQLAKNLFLTTHSTFLRKAIEMPLAYLTDLILTKDRILELYLNVVEWGPNGVFGAEAAARYHYGRSASHLSRDQAARLAACLPDPRRRQPQRMNRLSRSIRVRMGQLGH